MIEFNVKNIEIQFSNSQKLDTVDEILNFRDTQQASLNFHKSDIAMFGTLDFINYQGVHKIAKGVVNYAQRIQHLLMTNKGSMPSDLSVGIPWSKYLGQTYASKSILTSLLVADITNELYKDYGTKTVNFIKIDFITRNALSIVVSLTPYVDNNNVVISGQVQNGGG
jgi:hypothetical protein